MVCIKRICAVCSQGGYYISHLIFPMFGIVNQSSYMANSKVLKIFLDLFQNWADLCPLEASLSEMWWLQDTKTPDEP